MDFDDVEKLDCLNSIDRMLFRYYSIMKMDEIPVSEVVISIDDIVLETSVSFMNDLKEIIQININTLEKLREKELNKTLFLDDLVNCLPSDKRAVYSYDKTKCDYNRKLAWVTERLINLRKFYLYITEPKVEHYNHHVCVNKDNSSSGVLYLNYRFCKTMVKELEKQIKILEEYKADILNDTIDEKEEEQIIKDFSKEWEWMND